MGGILEDQVVWKFLGAGCQQDNVVFIYIGESANGISLMLI